jgi:hypothetical protein
MKRLTLHHDDSPTNPMERDGQWTLYSFNNRHNSYKDPDKFLPPSIGLRRKLTAGLAFLLSYYEHGNCEWSLQDQGVQDRWDTVRCAGILIWEHPVDEMGAKTYEDRAKDANSFLETYTCWCNGEVYGYTIEEVTTCEHCKQSVYKDVDSCWGYYGTDITYMAECVRAALDGDTDVEITGDAAFLADNRDFGQKKVA